MISFLKLPAARTYNTDMPYNFTHALVGLTALKQSNEAVSALVAANMGEFLIGTMGPDPYFGDGMPRPLFTHDRVDLAQKLHETDMRTIFTAMLPLAQTSAPRRAYALGFLCHFLLDTNAHPYIEARYPGSLHTPSEIQIDLMMTARVALPGVPAPPRGFYHMAHLDELDALHATLSKALFGADSAGAFARGFRKWIIVNTLSYDPNNRKLRFFGALERRFHREGQLTGYLVSRHPDPNDRLNLHHAAWRAPWSATVERTESFVDLFDYACAEGAALLNAALVALEGGSPDEALLLIGARRMDARPV